MWFLYLLRKKKSSPFQFTAIKLFGNIIGFIVKCIVTKLTKAIFPPEIIKSWVFRKMQLSQDIKSMYM